jgi:uncharacterized protein involved in type VI secretion and phage assembly
MAHFAGPIDAEPGDGQNSGMTAVAQAFVVRNDDPEGLCRVKLSFPWLDSGSETDWARIVIPFGMEAAPPSVGDEVLVAFDGGDLRFPYVLGRLPNRQKPK